MRAYPLNTDVYLLVGPLIVEMLNWDYQRRININEILEYSELPQWRELTGLSQDNNSSQGKRRRM